MARATKSTASNDDGHGHGPVTTLRMRKVLTLSMMTMACSPAPPPSQPQAPIQLTLAPPMVVPAPIAVAPTPPPPPRTLAADCKDHMIGSTSLKACLKGTSLVISETKRATKVKRTIDSEGTFEAIEIDHVNTEWLGLHYDDAECSVALIIDRKKGAVVADSGCENSRYCEVAALPAVGSCSATLACTPEGGTRSIIEVSLCKMPPPEEIMQHGAS